MSAPSFYCQSKLSSMYNRYQNINLLHLQIYPMMCGTCSNENAIKLMFMHYMTKQRDGRIDFTQEEMKSTMTNSTPGSPKLSILSFKGGFHGRTVGLLSCSNSRPIHGVDIPTLPWPKAEFPRYSWQHINESKVLHTYVMNEFLTAFCSRLTKHFWKTSY